MGLLECMVRSSIFNTAATEENIEGKVQPEIRQANRRGRDQRRWSVRNDAVRERAHDRKEAASFLSCLVYWLHLLARMQPPDRWVISLLLAWYQSSSSGAQAPKSRPDPIQVRCFGHQLSSLGLSEAPKACQQGSKYCAVPPLTFSPLVYSNDHLFLLNSEARCPILLSVNGPRYTGSSMERADDGIFGG